MVHAHTHTHTYTLEYHSSTKKGMKTFGTDIYTLLYVIQETNKDLVYSTGSSTRYSVMVHMGTESERVDRDFPGSPVARTQAPNAVGTRSIPGQGTRSHMVQLRVRVSQSQDLTCHNYRSNAPCTSTKTQCSQKNKHFKKFK